LNPLFAAVIVAVALGLAAFAQLLETTYTRLGRARARGLDEREGDRARSLGALVEDRERILGTASLLRVTGLVVAGAVVGVFVADRLGGWGGLAAVVVVVLIAQLVASAVPRHLGLEANDRMAVALARPARLVAALPPLRWPAGILSRLAARLAPVRRTPEHGDVGEDELIAMAEAAAEASVIESAEAGLIESIIQLGDTVAREIMVPRPDMVALSGDLTVDQALACIVESGYSRLPVHGPGGIDDVVGLVITKDLLKASLRGESDRTLRELVRDAWFIPETKRVSELMREMQARKAHQAVVVDEYGATAGLITLEDIIEELVGEIVDEYDEDRPLVERRPDGSLLVSGRLPIDELTALVGGELPEGGDWDTVGGLLFDLLGHVPTEGEEASWNGARLQAEKVLGRRIELVGVFPLES
jgi:putative hemolysin